MSEIKEIPLESLDPERFVADKVSEISRTVGAGSAVNALSGGVDSSVVTLLGHRALGERLKSFFIDTGLMRQDEPETIVSWFRKLGVAVTVVDAKDGFFDALKGLTDPEEKREAITDTFYRKVFGDVVRKSGARFLLQGTNYTDVEETVAGIKRQHNILEQLGIDTEARYGYRVLEPVIELRKRGIRMVGKALGLPAEMYERPPFPGPALATRVIGEVTRERVAAVRKATAVVEELLKDSGAFQYLAILHEDRVTGMRAGKRDFGFQVEVRCFDSTDAITGSPTRLPFDVLEKLARRITGEVEGVVSVTYNITTKPPSTIEAV
ncbi:MAG TPA: asparagine synthase-related protein [Syntrophales bacterium]|nr:asparagine synthase-related protein [Syntrophales bacterium]HPX10866.1 asparagine synthase-related protein [Syntrophales bacterium]HQB31292.1 asparagine synthase-related protein [Syntrophales bacterium]HQN78238.1 asparagine synthase-related protein [Syntrophales bacterium]HQQ27497.1 asparagine synthase-related protein [Syntrophales bacterium]